jgi:hypothetical protein
VIKYYKSGLKATADFQNPIFKVNNTQILTDPSQNTFEYSDFDSEEISDTESEEDRI